MWHSCLFYNMQKGGHTVRSGERRNKRTYSLEPIRLDGHLLHSMSRFLINHRWCVFSKPPIYVGALALRIRLNLPSSPVQPSGARAVYGIIHTSDEIHCYCGGISQLYASLFHPLRISSSKSRVYHAHLLASMGIHCRLPGIPWKCLASRGVCTREVWTGRRYSDELLAA